MSKAIDNRLQIEWFELYNYYRERICNIALAQFEWDGVSKKDSRTASMNMDFFERKLLCGKGAMIQPEGTDFWLTLDFVQKGGELDIYGDPVSVYGIGVNGKMIDPGAFELIWDNKTRSSLMPKIDLYARLLTEIHMTYRSNLKFQNIPYVVFGDTNKTLSFKNLFTQIFSFKPVVGLKSFVDKDEIQTLDLKVDFKGEEILENLKIVWSECMGMLGISCEGSIQKKERLISSEVDHLVRQQPVIELNSRLLNRIDLCNRMNEKYDLNLSVNLSSERNIDTSFEPYDPAAAMLDKFSDRDTDAEPGEKEGEDDE